MVVHKTLKFVDSAGARYRVNINGGDVKRFVRKMPCRGFCSERVRHGTQWPAADSAFKIWLDMEARVTNLYNLVYWIYLS